MGKHEEGRSPAKHFTPSGTIQIRPSAQSPWTNTMLGLVGISAPLLRHGDDDSTLWATRRLQLSHEHAIPCSRATRLALYPYQ
jgi:hypothetical protein